MKGGESGAVDVSAVIVNWNARDLLQACLESLRDHPPRDRSLEIVVVDNASTDGSADLVRTGWPDVVLEVPPENEGYQRANNRGVRLSRGKYLLLINSDAQLRAGALDAMVDRLEADDRAAVVGPRLVYADGSFQRWTAGHAPDLAGVASFFLFGEKLSRAAAHRSIYLAEDVREPFRPDWVSSACMLVRRDALDEVGLMDERYFYGMDDVDLCQRFRDAGWHVWYDPAAEVVHLMGDGRVTKKASPAGIRNFNDYFTRRHGPVAGAAARAMGCLGFGVRAAGYAGRSLVRPGGDDRAAGRDHLRNARVTLQRGHV
ncbi:MAG: glycosyltransferase family 2 protein [Acidimicrobiia bacterium]